jgi:hypothetical protein
LKEKLPQPEMNKLVITIDFGIIWSHICVFIW